MSVTKRKGNLFLYKLLIVMVPALFFFPQGTAAKVFNASDGTTASILAAIKTAVSGDTIRIPAGTFSFSGSVSLNAGITLLGAGSNATILKKTGTSTTPMFTVNGSNGLRTTISNLSLTGVVSGSSSVKDVGIRLNSCKDFHVYEMNFSNFGNACIYIKGNSRGLVRKCRFVDVYRPAIGSLGYGVVVYGDGSGAWSRPLDLGSENAIFVEDCYFKNNRHAIASNEGARYVFRYNTVVDNASNFQPVDAHGREYNSSRGTRSYEIYNNTIDNSVRTSVCQIYIRGGDGVIFNNSLLRGVTKNHIYLANRTDGSHTSTSYPAPDQTRNLYVWNNKKSDGSVAGVSIRSGHESFFKLGRDYWHEPMPGYTPYPYPHPLSAVPMLPKPSTAISEKTYSTPNETVLNMQAGILDYTPGKVIRYTMPKQAHVRLSIHDMHGRTIAVPLNKKQPAGIHEFKLDSGVGKKRIATSLYMYRLKIGKEIFTISKQSLKNQ